MFSKKKKCLVCEKKTDKYSTVRYKHADGIDEVYLCQTCTKEIEDNKVNDEESDNGFTF